VSKVAARSGGVRCGGARQRRDTGVVARCKRWRDASEVATSRHGVSDGGVGRRSASNGGVSDGGTGATRGAKWVFG
jgi:hypothetical protein